MNNHSLMYTCQPRYLSLSLKTLLSSASTINLRILKNYTSPPRNQQNYAARTTSRKTHSCTHSPIHYALSAPARHSPRHNFKLRYTHTYIYTYEWARERERLSLSSRFRAPQQQSPRNISWACRSSTFSLASMSAAFHFSARVRVSPTSRRRSFLCLRTWAAREYIWLYACR